MTALIGASVGVELEYVGDTDVVAEELAAKGWLPDSNRHNYHCRCDSCHFSTGLLFRYQHDSTVSGEFITRILYDWASVNHAFLLVERALTKANKPPKGHDDRWPWRPIVQTSMSTGLHVHVGSGICDWASLTTAYLLYERWMQRIGSGPFPDKREGMNITFLAALREQGRRPGQNVSIWTASELARSQVSNDRHIDLNYSQSNRTYEFRVFNSTVAAWQMELATRLSVAFCKAVNYGAFIIPETIRIPALPIQTLQPPMTLIEFVRAVSRYDDELESLIDKQLALFPREETPDPEPPSEPATEASPARRYDYRLRLSELLVSPDPPPSNGPVAGCYCERCITLLAVSSIEEMGAIWHPTPAVARMMSGEP